MSPATSIVKSPELTSISCPSIVILSTTTPAFAVKTPVGANVPVVVILPGSAILSTILSAVTASFTILAVVIVHQQEH